MVTMFQLSKPRHFYQLADFASYISGRSSDENIWGQFFSYSVLRGSAFTAGRSKVISRKNIDHVEIVDILHHGFLPHTDLFASEKSVEEIIDHCKNETKAELRSIHFNLPLTDISSVVMKNSGVLPLFAEYLADDQVYAQKILRYGKALVGAVKERGVSLSQGNANKRDYDLVRTVLGHMIK
ncbi:MAG TPA: hypothetical protein VK158_02315 [Acidobacteriota bacterium]|nr:hypothetical protein [Acidobacteriota bacterium]